MVMDLGLWHAHQRLYESQCDQSSKCTEVRVCFSTHGLKCMQIRNDCRILLSCLLISAARSVVFLGAKAVATASDKRNGLLSSSTC